MSEARPPTEPSGVSEPMRSTDDHAVGAVSAPKASARAQRRAQRRSASSPHASKFRIATAVLVGLCGGGDRGRGGGGSQRTPQAELGTVVGLAAV